MKGRNSEEVVKSMESTISMLKGSILATHQYYWKQTADLKKSLENQTKATEHMDSMYRSEREEKNYYIGRERKQRKQKGILAVGIGVLIGLLVIK